MTREEMASKISRYLISSNPNDPPMPVVAMAYAAAELRKTCMECKHFAKNHPNPEWRTVPTCFAKGMYRGHQPADGSGFCHRFEVKPVAPANTEGEK